MTDGRIQGDALSCYTTSIACYMQTLGVDYEIILGTQLFLAVDTKNKNDLPALAHYHTPLRGPSSIHSLRIDRRYSPEPLDLQVAIIDELKKYEAIIVVADTFFLPWNVNFDKQHMSHWVVIDGIDVSKTQVHVGDFFQSLEDNGPQSPYEGWVEVSEIPNIFQYCPDKYEFINIRESLAFGDQERLPEIFSNGYQWFEASGRFSISSSRGAVCELLLRTCSCNSQSESVNRLGKHWRGGHVALEYVLEFAKVNYKQLEFYSWQYDIWVIARNRLLFARTLKKLSKVLSLPSLNGLSVFCEDKIVASWNNIVRIMRYNRQCIEKKRMPKPLLIDILAKLVLDERQLVNELDEVLKTCDPTN